MSKLNREIGTNLHKIRLARGLTLDYVSQKMYENDCNMSTSMLSKIENNRQRIYADQLIILCKIYECSLSNVSCQENDIDIAIANSIQTEPMEVKKIVHFCLTKWSGNTTALWKFLGLYISMPPRIRQMIAGMGISTYNYAKQTKQIDSSAPPVDITYITKEYKKLLD